MSTDVRYCRRRLLSDDRMATAIGACPDCGHIMTVHPGLFQNVLDVCALCVQEQLNRITA